MNQPAINVTPLIDVLLVLLIIFMVITPIKPSSFDARVPSEPTNAPVEPNPNTIVLSYDPSGIVHINHEEATYSIDDPTPIANRFKAIFKEREENANLERTVFIKAPTGLDYGTVVRMIDVVKAGGADPISLQIDGLAEN
jgi:biopolymer transport protein TolR